MVRVLRTVCLQGIHGLTEGHRPVVVARSRHSVRCRRRKQIVLRYLARYTYRTAISLSRIESVDASSVRFRWKDYRDHQQKFMTLPGEEFLRRFLLHVLPKGFMRIRHYGYLANRVRVRALAEIQAALTASLHGDTALSEPDSDAAERLIPTVRCPKCKPGILRFVGEIRPERHRRRILAAIA